MEEKGFPEEHSEITADLPKATLTGFSVQSRRRRRLRDQISLSSGVGKLRSNRSTMTGLLGKQSRHPA